MHLLLHHLKTQIPLVGLLFVTLLLPIMLLHLALGLQQVVPPGLLLRDANAERYDHRMGILFFRGAFSNVGILLWRSAAVVNAFAYVLLRSRFRAEAYTVRARAFLLYMALLTALLALDDLFMLHEEVFLVRLGISEGAVYAVYGVLTAGLVCFTRFLVQTDFLVLILALGFFAFSMLSDQGMLRFPFKLPGRLDLLAEDMMKMLGIACWLVFSLRTAAQQLRLRADAGLQSTVVPPSSSAHASGSATRAPTQISADRR